MPVSCCMPPMPVSIWWMLSDSQSPLDARYQRVTRIGVVSAEYVSPVCLPFAEREEQFVGERPWAVGFGLTSARE